MLGSPSSRTYTTPWISGAPTRPRTRSSIEAYCDASWGRQPRDFFGFSIFFGGASVSACTKQIKIVSRLQRRRLSSTATRRPRVLCASLSCWSSSSGTRCACPRQSTRIARPPCRSSCGRARRRARATTRSSSSSDVSSALTACPSQSGLRRRGPLCQHLHEGARQDIVPPAHRASLLGATRH